MIINDIVCLVVVFARFVTEWAVMRYTRECQNRGYLCIGSCISVVTFRDNQRRVSVLKNLLSFPLLRVKVLHIPFYMIFEIYIYIYIFLYSH